MFFHQMPLPNIETGAVEVGTTYAGGLPEAVTVLSVDEDGAFSVDRGRIVDVSDHSSNDADAAQSSIDLAPWLSLNEIHNSEAVRAMRFGDGTHLKVTAPGETQLYFALVFVPIATATPARIAGQDTNAVTDEPAFTLRAN